MAKKVILLIAPTMVTLFFTVAAHGQEIPSGPLVRITNCSLNEGVTMAEAVAFARSQTWDETSPGAVFFRQSVYGGSYRENYDFTIASYFPSYGEMIRRFNAANARPNTRMRTFRRGSDLFTCDQSTRRLTQSHPVNQGNNDGFTGDGTLMTTRFCRVNDGKTIADAYAFAQGVASNFANAGDNSLYSMYRLEAGPIGDTLTGRGLVLATVPATQEAFAERMDLRRDGFDPLEGLRPLPVSCDAPAMWFTHAIHRGGNN
jgi:hypothetical protein